MVLAYWTLGVARAALPRRARSRLAEPVARHRHPRAGLFGSAADGTARRGADAESRSSCSASWPHRAAGAGYAVLRLDGREILAVPQGEDVEPGLRLAEVHADRVVLERNGVRETLAWPQKKTAANPPLRAIDK